MSLWGKVLGGVAGFAVGGPVGAVMGAALGHAADEGALPRLGADLGQTLNQVLGRGKMGSFGNPLSSPLGTARIAAMFGQREQLFAICVVALSAKLAKCDGPVKRIEIDQFKRSFRVPAESVRETGRLFDQARDSEESFELYATQLGEAFPDNRGMLEDVLVALFQIAQADGPVNPREREFLNRVHRRFGLDRMAWDQAQGSRASSRGGHSAGGRSNARGDRPSAEPDPYDIIGVPRNATNTVVRDAWKRLMRENHPDSLASRGVPAEFIASAHEKVARINAAWDSIKRERGL